MAEKIKITLKEVVGNKDKVAKISHFCGGNLYYKVDVNDSTYQFPIDVYDKADVGTTKFDTEIRAITLMRYIRKAIDSGDLIKIQ